VTRAPIQSPSPAAMLTLAASLVLMPGNASAQSPCEPAAGSPTAAEWLARARRAVGMTGADGVLRARGSDVSEFNYQSDRPYPPFAIQVNESLSYVDPATGVEWRGQPGSSRGILLTERAAATAKDSTLAPAPQQFASNAASRDLNPWAMLADWSHASDVRVKGRCRYRDYRRIVLDRTGPFGEERLFLHEGTGYPLRVERTEPHYLFGQVEAAYLYVTWYDPNLPWTAVRTVDGVPELERSYAGRGALVPRDSAPSLAVPANLPDMTGEIPTFLAPTPPDTVGIGPATTMLRNRGYAEIVTLVQDTVFVLDATQGEARARADSQWIGRLFPGRHPIVVVVTDLAWPHIAGVRFWVASGATIVSHRANRAFLERVVQRPWTLHPDRLERTRARARFRFVAVDDSLSLASGRLRLYAIDGVGSEASLMAYLPGDRFLWASDFLQRVDAPTLYATEVRAAVDRHGLRPDRVAAEHLTVTEWARIEAITVR
jgi:hypothetical protein